MIDALTSDLPARHVRPCGTVFIIAKATRKVVKAYLDQHGYQWDKRWELWTNGKDEDLIWGSTMQGHHLFVA
jgi:hypothetical protein